MWKETTTAYSCGFGLAVSVVDVGGFVVSNVGVGKGILPDFPSFFFFGRT